MQSSISRWPAKPRAAHHPGPEGSQRWAPLLHAGLIAVLLFAVSVLINLVRAGG